MTEKKTLTIIKKKEPPKIIIHEDFDFDEYFNNIDDFTSIIASPRRGGKTTLIKYLIKFHFVKKFKKENIILIKDSLQDDENYSSYLHEENILEFDPYIISELIDYQKNLKKEKKSTKLLLIFDDCMNDNKLKKSKATEKFQEIFFNGRHFDISVLFSSQYPQIIKSSWIANTDLIIVRNVLSENFLEHIRKNFASHLTKTTFIRTLKEIYDESIYYNVIFDSLTHKIYKINLYIEIIDKTKKTKNIMQKDMDKFVLGFNEKMKENEKKYEEFANTPKNYSPFNDKDECIIF